MTAFVRIKSGSYRNFKVEGQVFQLVEQLRQGAKGGYVTVVNGGAFPGFPENVKIKVDSLRSYEMVGSDAFEGTAQVDSDVEVVAEETDEQVMERIGERFEILTDMTKAVIGGDIRAMIVAGPPGVGKSYNVEREIEKAQLFDQIQNKRLHSEIIKGSVTPVTLYATLYKYSDPGSVLVFDDCDAALLDDVSLNLLKGALDSGKRRKISWLADSSYLRNEGIPDTFDFRGSIIFITNVKFDKVKGKLAEHTNALMSRCHYLDLTIDTTREKILRITQIARSGALFADYDFEESAVEELVEFMTKNQTRLRELSLRMALKIADLRKSFPQRWMAMAATTCMKA